MRPIHRSRQRAQLIAAISDRQHHVIAHSQLLAAGIHERTIGRWIEVGRLHPVFRGVYAVGRRDVPREGRWTAGVLAAGPDSVLSHRSMAALHRILNWTGVVEVTAPRPLRPRRGLRPHHSSLPADELTVVEGIPGTTVPRTLLDLAAVLSPHRLEGAVNRAEMLRLGGVPSSRDLIARYPGRRGVARLRAVLDGLDAGMAVTRSELEERFRRFLGPSRLPKPELNAPIEIHGRWYVIDCLWREQRLAVELDGYESHGTRRAFRGDRARDRVLLAAGFRTARITWWDLSAPATLEAELTAMLAVASAHRAA